MEWLQIWLEPRAQDRALNVLMERKEMRMPFTHTHPDDRRVPPRIKRPNALQRDKEARHSNLLELLNERFFFAGVHIAKEAKRQVHLFGRQPTQPPDARIDLRDGGLAGVWNLNPDEEALFESHGARANPRNDRIIIAAAKIISAV